MQSCELALTRSGALEANEAQHVGEGVHTFSLPQLEEGCPPLAGRPAPRRGSAPRPARPPASNGCGLRARRSARRGIPAASRRPSSKGCTASPRQCRTSVGTRTRAKSSSTSKAVTERRMFAALSGEAVLRCSSLNHCICSAVASGMKAVVKSWRKAGFLRPQPWRIRISSASIWRSISGEPCLHQPRA